MLRTAIVGLGWWGKTLVESVQRTSDVIQFKAGVVRTVSPELKAFGELHKMKLVGRVDEVLSDPKIDAIVLATPHSLHSQQVIAAATAGKHVFCEKPLALHKSEAEAAVAAVRAARVTLGLGYNRRLHPEMTKLRERIRSGGLGTIMHVEATMTIPNALLLKAEQWRADREETPVGGLTPLGVHAIDGMIDLCGEIDSVYCLSFHRVIEVDADDTSSMIFRMKAGMSGYLGTMTATGPGFSFQVFGSKGFVRLEGMTHVVGASSEKRRTQLFGTCKFQPIKGEPEIWEGEPFDTVRAVLEAFGTAAAGGSPFPITLDEMIHGVAVTEAVIRSAGSGKVERL
jgi:predicted dehydrogenase